MKSLLRTLAAATALTLPAIVGSGRVGAATPIGTTAAKVAPSYASFPDPWVLWDPGTALYWAYSTDQGSTNIPVMSSTDLVHWSAISDALPSLPSWASPPDTWAPSVARFGSTWVMWYTAHDTALNMQCLSVATATAPGGRFTDSSTGPAICQTSDGGSIDPNITFIHSAPVLVWKSDDNSIGQPTHLWEASLASSGLTTTSPPVELLSSGDPWQGGVIEGPTVATQGATAYLFYGANAYYSARSGIGYATCTEVGNVPQCTNQSVTGPWFGTTGPIVGPQGPTVFTDATGALRLAFAAYDNCTPGSQGCTRALWIAHLSFVKGVPHLSQ